MRANSAGVLERRASRSGRSRRARRRARPRRRRAGAARRAAAASRACATGARTGSLTRRRAPARKGFVARSSAERRRRRRGRTEHGVSGGYSASSEAMRRLRAWPNRRPRRSVRPTEPAKSTSPAYRAPSTRKARCAGRVAGNASARRPRTGPSSRRSPPSSRWSGSIRAEVVVARIVVHVSSSSGGASRRLHVYSRACATGPRRATPPTWSMWPCVTRTAIGSSFRSAISSRIRDGFVAGIDDEARRSSSGRRTR